MKTIFLLDMDDTLLDFEEAERRNFLRTAALFSLDGKAMISRFHEINEELWKALERGEMSRERLKIERFERLFGEFSVRADPLAVAREYVSGFPEICVPFDGAAEFLRALRGKGRLYLVTNGGKEIQRRHLSLSGFSPYFCGLFISEEIGFQKPSLGFAEYVAEHIEGFCREQAVWIGDSLTSDGECARLAGIDFVRFCPHKSPRAEYRRILSLLE